MTLTWSDTHTCTAPHVLRQTHTCTDTQYTWMVVVVYWFLMVVVVYWFLMVVVATGS